MNANNVQSAKGVRAKNSQSQRRNLQPQNLQRQGPHALSDAALLGQRPKTSSSSFKTSFPVDVGQNGQQRFMSSQAQLGLGSHQTQHTSQVHLKHDLLASR